MISQIDFNGLVALLPFEADEMPPLWVIGSGMTVTSNGTKGVAGTRELAERFTKRWKELGLAPDAIAIADGLLSKSSQDKISSFEFYQEATGLYHQVQDSQKDLSQRYLMRQIRRSVIKAHKARNNLKVDDEIGLEREVWLNPGRWRLREGLRSIARYILCHPNRRSHAIFTTNFDPLMSVALLREGVSHSRVAFEREDYSLSRIAADVPVIYHVHGYWTGTNTLNLSKEMMSKNRQVLASSVAALMDRRTVVVVGYGGWDDVITEAIAEILESPETSVIWVLHGESQLPPLLVDRIAPLPGKLYYLNVADGDSLLVAIAKRAFDSPGADPIGSRIAALNKELDKANTKLKKREDHKQTLTAIQNRTEASHQTLIRMDERLNQVIQATGTTSDVLLDVTIVKERLETVLSNTAKNSDQNIELKSSLGAYTSTLETITSAAASHQNTAKEFEKHRIMQTRKLYLIIFLCAVGAAAALAGLAFAVMLYSSLVPHGSTKQSSTETISAAAPPAIVGQGRLAYVVDVTGTVRRRGFCSSERFLWRD